MSSFPEFPANEESDNLEDLASGSEADTRYEQDNSPQKHTTDLTDFPSASVLSERTKSQSDPLLPGRNRKRSSDEIYRRSQPPTFSTPDSTTPRHPPPTTLPFPYRPFADGRKRLDNPFAPREGPSSLHNVMTPNSPPQSSTVTVTAPIELIPESPPPVSFVDEISSYQAGLDVEFETFVKDLDQRDRTKSLEKLDWTELEERYMNEMRPLIDAEGALHAEVGQTMQQFLLWSQVSSEKENERAFKRLRTRSAFVQNSEQELAKKEEHYIKVLGAFETAMALLRA